MMVSECGRDDAWLLNDGVLFPAVSFCISTPAGSKRASVLFCQDWGYFKALNKVSALQ